MNFNEARVKNNEKLSKTDYIYVFDRKNDFFIFISVFWLNPAV